MRFGVRVLGSAALLFVVLASGTEPARADHAAEAESLYHRALGYLARDNVEARRMAAVCLERATLLAPRNPEYELVLARTYYRMGHLKMARARYQRVERLRPEDLEARVGLGMVWRRDYLKYLDRTSLDRAIQHFTEAARRHPRAAEPWLQLVPLQIENGHIEEAATAAERAWEADRALPNAVLAVAHTAYRRGQVERADSLFRSVLSRLPRVVRERYDDLAPVASEQDTATFNPLPPQGKREFSRRFWREHDPDLATPENEAQLEYWSRVTQAYFLFFDPKRREWDQRGEVYVRYGPPQKADYNPVGTSGFHRYESRGLTVINGLFPMNTLVWSYPELGMNVAMHDWLLTEKYMKPISIDRETDPAPNPDSLAALEDRLATRGGRGVFHQLPPNTRRLRVDGVLARFESDRGPRLLGLLQALGTPSDSMWADWVVLDSARIEVARGRRALSPSACDAAALRVADFASDLPPGQYLAGFSVRDGRGGRGVYRENLELDRPRTSLALSDVVVSCGGPDIEPGGADQPPAVRLTANPASRVRGGAPLTVYFEMYHLQPGTDGLAHVEFEYTVRSAERDRRVWLQRLLAPRRPTPEVSATRRDEQPGTVRRQFVSVPLGSLPAGRYRLEIRVRDLVAGIESSTVTEFLKEPSLPGS